METTLTSEIKDSLVKQAIEARKLAYAPYSGYLVGAAILTASGRVFTGCNVESAAYPTSMCAERVAIFKAVSEGEREFSALAVATENGGTPCGSCRQVLAEFGLETVVLVADTAGEVKREARVEDLLPGAFTGKTFNVKR